MKLDIMTHKSSHSTNGPDQESLRAGHEPAGPSTKIAVYFVVGLVLLMLAGLMISWEFRRLLGEDWPGNVADVEVTLPPETPSEPPLDPQQPTTLRELRAAKTALLTEYDWVDPLSGIARIPIDRAMAIVEERGLPEWGVPEKLPAPRNQR